MESTVVLASLLFADGDQVSVEALPAATTLLPLSEQDVRLASLLRLLSRLGRHDILGLKLNELLELRHLVFLALLALIDGFLEGTWESSHTLLGIL